MVIRLRNESIFSAYTAILGAQDNPLNGRLLINQVNNGVVYVGTRRR